MTASYNPNIYFVQWQPSPGVLGPQPQTTALVDVDDVDVDGLVRVSIAAANGPVVSNETILIRDVEGGFGPARVIDLTDRFFRVQPIRAAWVFPDDAVPTLRPLTTLLGRAS
jgi:hypothetical protein